MAETHANSVPDTFLAEYLNTVKWYLLAMGAGVAAFAVVSVAFEEQFARLDPANPVTLVVGGTVLALLGWLGADVWQARRRRARLVAIGAVEVVAPSAHFRLAPRDAQDHDGFTRGDRAHKRVRDWILNEAERPLLVLTGRSGVGKSSLLSAWVLPELTAAADPVHVVAVRGFADPLTALREELLRPNAVWEKPQRRESARAALEAAAKHVAPKRLLVVLDQFEEFLILADKEAQAPFGDFLQNLVANPVRGATLLLVARSDGEYLAELHDLVRNGLTPGETWEVVDGFEPPEARAFLGCAGLGLSEAMLTEVLAEAKRLEGGGARVRPIVLNLLGLAVSRHAGAAVPRSVEGLAGGYIRDAVTDPDVRDLGPALLGPMITDAGTKQPRRLVELAAFTGHTEAALRGCLALLARAGLVRELDRASGTWEIAHDFLAQLIGRALGRLHPAPWRAWARQAGPWALAAWLAAVPVGWLVWLDWDQKRLHQEIGRNGTILIPQDGGYDVVLGSRVRQPEDGGTELQRLLPLLARLDAPLLRLEIVSQPDTAITLPDQLPMTELIVQENNALAALELPDELPVLTHLIVWGNDALAALDLPDELPDLTHLSVRGSDALAALDLPDELPVLTHLSVQDNDALAALDLPDQLTDLTQLFVSGNVDLSRICAAPSARLGHLAFEGQGAFASQC